jgi:peptidoglycan-associated lipoprotein
MRLKAFTAVAALLFIAACATASEESGDASGSGGAAASTGSSTQTARAGTGSTQESMKADAPKPGSYAELVANVGDRVLFEFDKYDLQAQARQTLDRQATWLKQHPSVTVRVEGHCDERGTREYNLALGQRRGAAVRDYLVALGVSASRVDVISYGKERPEVVGSNDGAWAQNRRGVTTIN